MIFPRRSGTGIHGDLATGAYEREIAPARTFGWREDEKKLRDMGLIRGATEESVDRAFAQGVLNGHLRFADEFVRHKVLDLIGDLALAGHQILGQVVAERAGHAMHTALVSRLLRDRSAWQLVTLGTEKMKAKTAPARTPSLVTA